MPPEEVFVLNDLEALKAMFDPVRKRIINELSHEPRTVQQVAEVLQVPFTRLYYHFNMLEKFGLIRLVETRTLAGAVEEKYYQVVAYTFKIDRSLLTFGDQPHGGLHTILQLTADHMQEEVLNSVQAGVIDLDAKSPDPRSLFIWQGIMHLTPEQAVRVHETLLKLKDEFMQEHLTTADDQTYGFTMVLYPTVRTGRDQDEGTPETQ